MALVLRRTALFLVIVVVWALFAAIVAHARAAPLASVPAPTTVR